MAVPLRALRSKRQDKAVVVRWAEELHDLLERVHLDEPGHSSKANEDAPLPADHQVMPDSVAAVDFGDAATRNLAIRPYPVPRDDVEGIDAWHVGVVISMKVAG